MPFCGYLSTGWRARDGPTALHPLLPFATRYIKRFKLFARISQRLAARLSRLQIKQRHHDRGDGSDEHIQQLVQRRRA